MVCKGGPSTAHLQGQQFPSGCTKLGSPTDQAGISSSGPRVLTPPHARSWMEMASQSQAVLSPLHGLGAKRKEITQVPGSKGHVVKPGLSWPLGFVDAERCSSSLGDEDPRMPSCHGVQAFRKGGSGLAWGWQVAKGRDGVCAWLATERRLCAAHGEMVQHRPGLQLQLVQGEEAPDEDVHHSHLRHCRWEPGGHLHLPQVWAWGWGGQAGGAPPWCHAWGYVWAGASPPAPLMSSCCRGDQCEKRNSLYTKTEQPGRFSYSSPRECLAPSPSSCGAAPDMPTALSPSLLSCIPAATLARAPQGWLGGRG